MELLKFCGSSVNYPGHYRWFQSHHAQVNKLIEDTLGIVGISTSKTAWREMVIRFEKELGLPPTPPPESEIRNAQTR